MSDGVMSDSPPLANRSCHIWQERVRDVCRLLDRDGDGMIDFDEFSSAMAAKVPHHE